MNLKKLFKGKKVEPETAALPELVSSSSIESPIDLDGQSLHSFNFTSNQNGSENSNQRIPLTINTDLNMTKNPKLMHMQSSKVEECNFVSIGLRLVASPMDEVDVSCQLPVNNKSISNRNSHRFSNISPNYKIKRLPVETIEALNATFSEFVGGEDALQYKSLDPLAKAAYLLEPRNASKLNKKHESIISSVSNLMLKSPSQHFQVSFSPVFNNDAKFANFSELEENDYLESKTPTVAI